jgi:hypothetical protein
MRKLQCPKDGRESEISAVTYVEIGSWICPECFSLYKVQKNELSEEIILVKGEPPDLLHG